MTVEVTAKKVDDAIKEGLEKLGATLDQVTVEVLESGGLFRKAKVRLTLDGNESPVLSAPKNAERNEVNVSPEKSDSIPPEKAEKKPTDVPEKAEKVHEKSEKPASAAKKSEHKPEKQVKAKAKNSESKNEFAPRTSAQSPTENGQRAEKSQADENTPNDTASDRSNDTASDMKDRKDVKKPLPKKQVGNGERPAQSNRKKSAEELKALEGALEFIKTTVEKMGFDVTVKPAENDPEHIEIDAAEGDDSLIIGRHGETLSALSYLAETCARAEKTRINVTVDCNGYRSRRAASLTSMARRRADECAAKHRKIKLEPMERIDRRTIHTALGDDDRVTTASEGKEPYRYVVIYPSRDSRRTAASEETEE